MAYEPKGSEIVYPCIEVQHIFLISQERKRIKGHGVGIIFFYLKSISLEGKSYSLCEINGKDTLYSESSFDIFQERTTGH